jgi:hypothetical protein
MLEIKPLYLNHRTIIHSLLLTLLVAPHAYATSPVYVPDMPTLSRFPDISYPPIDPTLGEHLNPNEEALALDLARESAAKMKEQQALEAANPSWKPKMCGCIKAKFNIEPNLPKELAQGVFVPNKSYDAWLKFTSSDRDFTHGSGTREARRVVIKLTNIPGKKLSDDDEGAQDFVLLNRVSGYIRDPRRYLQLMTDTNGVMLRKTMIPFSIGMNGAISSVDAVATTITDPLTAQYWSVVASQLGLGAHRVAVKYALRACTPETLRMHIDLTPDYLHDAINGRVKKSPSCMQFLVQPRTSPLMDVEDISVPWKESSAPFYVVATLRIPAQDIETAGQNAQCENLSFSPWHSLPAHRPLGMTNRLRKAVFDHMVSIKSKS